MTMLLGPHRIGGENGGGKIAFYISDTDFVSGKQDVKAGRSGVIRTLDPHVPNVCQTRTSRIVDMMPPNCPFRSCPDSQVSDARSNLF
jgi:hypothetical protein